jgi:hypothetical protein
MTGKFEFDGTLVAFHVSEVALRKSLCTVFSVPTRGTYSFTLRSSFGSAKNAARAAAFQMAARAAIAATTTTTASTRTSTSTNIAGDRHLTATAIASGEVTETKTAGGKRAASEVCGGGERASKRAKRSSDEIDKIDEIEGSDDCDDFSTLCAEAAHLRRIIEEYRARDEQLALRRQPPPLPPPLEPLVSDAPSGTWAPGAEGCVLSGPIF